MAGGIGRYAGYYNGSVGFEPNGVSGACCNGNNIRPFLHVHFAFGSVSGGDGGSVRFEPDDMRCADGNGDQVSPFQTGLELLGEDSKQGKRSVFFKQKRAAIRNAESGGERSAACEIVKVAAQRACGEKLSAFADADNAVFSGGNKGNAVSLIGLAAQDVFLLAGNDDGAVCLQPDG